MVAVCKRRYKTDKVFPLLALLDPPGIYIVITQPESNYRNPRRFSYYLFIRIFTLDSAMLCRGRGELFAQFLSCMSAISNLGLVKVHSRLWTDLVE